MATPLQLMIAIHYATGGGDFRDGDFSAPAVRDTIDSFVFRGLLEKRPGDTESYVRTDGIIKWVEALCSVDPPRRVWMFDHEKAGE